MGAKDYPNPASSLRTGAIALYNTAMTSKKDPSLARLLTHELAHEMYIRLSDVDQSLNSHTPNHRIKIL